MVNATQIIDRCRALAAITDVPGETTRTFLSPAMRRANQQLMTWATEGGFPSHYDAAGNVRILRSASEKTDRTFILASHLDTVPNAGAFDGPLGVILGLSLLENASPLPYNLELIAFSEEEGVRFGFPFIGSKALTGELTDDLLDHTDKDCISVREAMEGFDLNPDNLPKARLHAGHIGYLEFHIEQGPVLEHEGRALGLVTSIIGQSRSTITFTGKANHAGTTPMPLRYDALTAAAQFILSVEQHARDTQGLVATVGSIHARPGAANVVPGEVVVSLDLRHADDAIRLASLHTLLETASSIAISRGITLTHQQKLDQPAVPMSPKIYESPAWGIERRMTSGAGHDAMVLAPHIPTGMVFLRTPGGLSHHPDETVLAEDVQLAFEAGLRFLESYV